MAKSSTLRYGDNPADGERTSRALAALAPIAAALIYVQLLVFGADDGILAAVFAMVEMIFAAITLLVLGLEESNRLWRSLAAPLGLMAMAAIWAGLSQAFGAPFAPDAAPLELIKLGGVAALFVAGALIGRDRSRFESLAISIATLGLAFALLSLLLAKGDPLTVWGQSKGAHTFRFTGTLLNANAAGCVFGMIALVSLGTGLSLVRRMDWRQAGLWRCFQMMLVACAALANLTAGVLTASRTSLIVMLLLGALVVVVSARGRRTMHPLLLVGLLGLVAAGATLGLAQVASRWHSLGTDSGQRVLAYDQYIQLTHKAPWFGAGLGGFRSLNQSSLSPATAPYLWDYGAAHSVVLQAALEGGWPFAMLLTAAILITVTMIAMNLRGGALGGIDAGILAAPVLAGACAMVDIALNIPAIAAFAALLIGNALGASVPRRSHKRNVGDENSVGSHG